MSKWEEEDPGLLSVFSLFFQTCLWSLKLSDQFLDLIAPFTLGELSVWLLGPPGACRPRLQKDGVLPVLPFGGQERDRWLGQRDCDEWMDWGPVTVSGDTTVTSLEPCFQWRVDKLVSHDKTETRAVKRHGDIAFGDL